MRHFNLSTDLKRQFHSKVAVATATSLVVGCTLAFPSLATAASYTRYNLKYARTAGVGSLSGYIELDNTAAAALNTYVGSPFPGWVGGLSLSYDNGTTTSTYQKSDFDSFWWMPNNPSVNWGADLVNQFLDINFGHQVEPTSYPAITNYAQKMMSSLDPYTNQYKLTNATVVPSPLPVLGAAGAFTWSRRLRRRLSGVASAKAI